MTKRKFGTAIILPLGLFLGVIFWQHQKLQDLRQEHLRLELRLSELQESNDQKERIEEKPDPAKSEQIKKDQVELLRLRDEVGRLRRQARLAQSPDGKQKSPEPDETKADLEETPGPVDKFVSNARAVLAPQETLVTGGWKTPGGKRALVFVEPGIEGTPGQPAQVTIRSRVVEVPEEVMSRLGMEGLISEGKQSSAQTVMSKSQIDALFKTLEQSTGVDIRASHRITTLDGRQGQVSVFNQKSIQGQNYELGHSIDILPQISPDRNSIDLTVISRLQLEK